MINTEDKWAILIKGIEMPKDVTLLAISPDGTVAIISNQSDLSWKTLKDKAVQIPPYGRLIDTDVLRAEINKICERRDAGIITDLTCINQILSVLRNTSVIIEIKEEK